AIEWEFPGILGDLIGDLTWSPDPIEIKLYSTDLDFLKKTAPQVEEAIKTVKGVVDSKSGIIVAGPSVVLRVRPEQAQRFGMDADDVATAVNTALFGQTASPPAPSNSAASISSSRKLFTICSSSSPPQFCSSSPSSSWNSAPISNPSPSSLGQSSHSSAPSSPCGSPAHL